jgi:nitroreductase
MDLLEGIYTRRSVRSYTRQPVENDLLIEIIRAGTWAPSGLNNQPWRFVVIREKQVLLKLAALTKYGKIIESSPASIAVFADREVMYSEVKDYQAMGACMQNMLLAAHALGLGAVWIGEILKNAEPVRQLLELPPQMELMAVIVLGHPSPSQRKSSRKSIEEVLLKEL